MKKILLILMIALTLYAGVTEGDRAVDFTLSTLDATQQHTLTELKGKVILLNLWASWCGGCQKEMPEFFKLQSSYANNFEIVTVSIDKNAQNSIDFLEEVSQDLKMKIPFKTLYDPQKKLAKAYGAMGMPSSYLIDKEGVVRMVIVGSFNHDDIEALRQKIDLLIKQ